MKPLVIILLLVTASTTLLANEPGDSTVMNEGLKKLQDLDHALTVTPECDPTDLISPLSCGDITDNFCYMLWDKNHKGSMKLFDGEISTGVTGKSEMSKQRMADYRALLASSPRLPADLREKVGPILKELEESLAKERDEDPWYKEVSLIKQKFDMAVNELARDRAKAQRPELKNIKDEDLTVEQNAYYKKILFDISDQVLDAKYAQSENWKRVEALYPLVKKNLLDQVAKLKIPDYRKEMMLEKVRSAELTLPYLDVKKADASASCGSTELNAFYSPSNHRFVVCAGLFNLYRSPSALAVVIAHEIGHGIDSESLAQEDWHRESPVAARLQKLVHAKGPAYTCEEWKNLQNTVFKRNSEIRLRAPGSLDNLYSCLVSRNDLKEFNTANVRSAAEIAARSEMSSAANRNSFTNLTQPTFNKYGQVKQNEIYLRPDLLAARQSGYFDNESARNANASEIFVQSLACQEAEENGKKVNHAAASRNVRQQLFSQALQETSEIIKAENEDYYTYCGKTCEDNTYAGLSVNPRENNADWFGFRAFTPYLESVPREHRAEASASGMAFFCGSPDTTTDAPELTKVEKTYSLESHPDDRLRRLGLYIPANAEAVGCKLEENEKGYGACEP